MQSILVLIAAPNSGAIDRSLIEAFGKLGAAEPNWLGIGEAVELSLAHPLAEDAARQLIADRPIDLAVLPAKGRAKRLLLADMDSTMIAQECIDELGSIAGVGEEIRAITARAMRGELEFEDSLRERVGLMRGLPLDALARVLSERITFTPGGRALVKTMRANGAYAALVSGGFVQFTGYVSEQLGFDEHRANILLFEAGRLTGKVQEPILGKDAKVTALHELTGRLRIGPADVIAVGDGANDVPMLRAAGLGVAMHAKPKVRAATPVRIDHGDLTALLYLQGYRRDDFVN